MVIRQFLTLFRHYIYVCVTVGWCTGTLDGLVGSHTRLAIYPSLTIHCQRVVIRASLDTRFKGMQVVTYPVNIKQLESHWLKVPRKGLGTCIWINKSHNPFWLCTCTVGKPLCMCIGNIAIHLNICWHPHQNPKYYKCIWTSPSFP